MGPEGHSPHSPLSLAVWTFLINWSHISCIILIDNDRIMRDVDCNQSKTVMSSNGQRDLAPERQRHLVNIVSERGFVRVDELCGLLEVSPATIRRDLETLEERRQLRRVHGGAMSVRNRIIEPQFDDKTALASSEKRFIAARATALVEAGDSVYLDGGSTVLELARQIRDRTDITVVTNSLRAAVELSQGGPGLILIGGQLRRRSQTMVGTLTRQVIDEIHLDKAFMGTIGMTLREGMTTTDADEAFTKELVMQHADKVYLLADSSKLGKVAFARAGNAADIDALITDAEISPDLAGELRKKGIEVIVAGEDL